VPAALRSPPVWGVSRRRAVPAALRRSHPDVDGATLPSLRSRYVVARPRLATSLQGGRRPHRALAPWCP